MVAEHWYQQHGFQRKVSSCRNETLTPQQMPWLGFTEVSIVQGPKKILSGHFVQVWSPMFDWDGPGGKLGSKGLLRELGSRRGAGVLSLMEHGAAEIQSFSTNMGEEKERREAGEREEGCLGSGTRLAQEQTQADTFRLNLGESCYHHSEFRASCPLGIQKATKIYSGCSSVLDKECSCSSSEVLAPSPSACAALGSGSMEQTSACHRNLFHLTLNLDCI